MKHGLLIVAFLASTAVAEATELSPELVGTWKQVSKVCETTGEVIDLSERYFGNANLVFRRNGEYGVKGQAMGRVVQDQERSVLVFQDYQMKPQVGRVYLYNLQGSDQLQITFWADDLNVGECSKGQFETLTLQKVEGASNDNEPADSFKYRDMEDTAGLYTDCQAYEDRLSRLEKDWNKLNSQEKGTPYGQWLSDHMEIMRRSIVTCERRRG